MSSGDGNTPTLCFNSSTIYFLDSIITQVAVFTDSPPQPHLDLLDGVDDEGVLQVLHGALHPVVEGSRSFGKLKVQLVDGFKQLLGSLSTAKHA